MGNRKVRMQGYGKIPGCIGALCYMVLGFMKEIVFTIFGQTNIQLTNDRVGVTRSAMFLFVLIVIHAVGNLHIFLGPDDFNGYGYFYVRLYPSGFGLPANIVEEYVLLAAMMHVAIALKRTWDISINYTIASGKLNLAFSGITLLTFMMIHLFWVGYEGCKATYVRDIYRMEFEVFQSLGWVMFYLSAVIIFSTHMCLGWQKVVPAPSMDIPKRYQSKAIHMGYVMTVFIALVYASFPIYGHLV